MANLQRWFFSVRSPCITGTKHWSHPLQRAETELLWNFGVKYLQHLQSYLEIFIYHLAAAVPLLDSGNRQYHWFVNILLRYDLFWWLVSVKSCSNSALQHSGTNVAFLYLSVWLIGQGSWHFCHRCELIPCSLKLRLSCCVAAYCKFCYF